MILYIVFISVLVSLNISLIKLEKLRQDIKYFEQQKELAYEVGPEIEENENYYCVETHIETLDKRRKGAQILHTLITISILLLNAAIVLLYAG